MIAESTIAAVFKCKDGVVLCADTQLTKPGYLKYPESKVKLYTGLPYHAFFAYAGDADFSKMCIERIARQLRENSFKQERHPVEVLKDEAREIHCEYSQLYPNGERDLTLQLLGAFQSSRFLYLFKVLGPTVCQVGTYECIGSGEGIGRSIIRPLFVPSLTVHEVSFVATYAVGQASKYAEGVGDQAQVVLIWSKPFERHPVAYDVLSAATVKNLMEGYTQIQEKLAPLLLHQRNTVVSNDATFDTYLRELSTAIQVASDGRCGITGQDEQKYFDSVADQQEDEPTAIGGDSSTTD